MHTALWLILAAPARAALVISEPESCEVSLLDLGTACRVDYQPAPGNAAASPRVVFLRHMETTAHGPDVQDVFGLSEAGRAAARSLGYGMAKAGRYVERVVAIQQKVPCGRGVTAETRSRQNLQTAELLVEGYAAERSRLGLEPVDLAGEQIQVPRVPDTCDGKPDWGDSVRWARKLMAEIGSGQRALRGDVVVVTPVQGPYLDLLTGSEALVDAEASAVLQRTARGDMPDTFREVAVGEELPSPESVRSPPAEAAGRKRANLRRERWGKWLYDGNGMIFECTGAEWTADRLNLREVTFADLRPFFHDD